MGKIAEFFDKSSIKTTFVLYTIICLIVALLLSVILNSCCQFGRQIIDKKYRKEFESQMGIEAHITNEIDKSQFPITLYSGQINYYYTNSEKIIYEVLNILSIIVIPISFIICIIITSTLFYKRKLKRPLEILDKAADNISNNSLDFTVEYGIHDEMGKLCTSFEKMRATLQQNNSEMWRQIEERKRLNAAFSHDLRTPLTVLKGHTDMLCRYVPNGKMSPEKVAKTAVIMSEHITRLENYVNGMSSLQKLEDIEIHILPINQSEFLHKLKCTAEIICEPLTVQINDNCGCATCVYLDEQVVLEVFDNLISNALQYATQHITINFNIKSDTFIIKVSDDGCGFDKISLSNATNPFYKSKENVYDNHFGIGLNICKILSEKHGGGIIISNNSTAGACVTVAFEMKII